MPGAGILARGAAKVGSALAKKSGLFVPHKVTGIEKALLPVRYSLRAQGGDAGRAIGDGLINARNMSKDTHGNTMVAVKRVLDTFTPDEDVALAAALRGTPNVGGRAASVVRGLEPLFQSTAETPSLVLQRILTRHQFDKRVLNSGKELLNMAMVEHEDTFARHLVRTEIQPHIKKLATPELRELAQQATNNVLNRTGSGGTLSNLRAFNTATLLGRAVLLNLSQPSLGVISAEPAQCTWR